MPSDRRLLDQFGEPVPAAAVAALRQEISAPGAIHARPPFEGHLAFGMDPARLGSIIRAADSGNSREWMILAEEIEELFPHYQAVLSKRRRQLIQLPITVKDAGDDAASKKHGDLVRDWLDSGVLQRALFDITDAMGKGYSVSEIIWDSEPGRVVPGELAYRTPRFFELSYIDGATVWLRTESGFTDLKRHKYLVHAHRSKSGLVVRSGLTRAVAFLWLYASYTSKDWALFTQAYGLPIRVGRYGPEASETDKRVLWRAVSSIAGDVAAIIPKSMEIEFVEANKGTASNELYLKRADWINFETSKLVLGSTAGTDATTGSRAASGAHREVEQDVERFDCQLLETSITRQLVQTMVSFTFGPQKKYPTLSIGRPDETPLKDVIAAVADLGGMGLKVRAREIRDRLQLSEPEEGDEIIGGVAAPPKIPSLAVTPPSEPDVDTGVDLNSRSTWLGGLITRHSEAPPEIVEQLTQRLAEDAAGAMAGLTKLVRRQFEEASDLHDLVRRIHGLKLPEDEFAEAMARGMALANLVGQASLVDELHVRTERMAELDAAARGKLQPQDYAVPDKEKLPIRDAEHVKLAWDMVDRTEGLTAAERRQARRRILARARRLGIDTSGWAK